MRYPLSTTLGTIPPSGIRRFFDLVVEAKDIISLGVGEPDFDTPESIRNTSINAIQNGLTTYTSNNGLPELRQEISQYLDTRFGVKYDPTNEIIVTNGVSEGVDISLRAILNPGDEVLLPVPNYVCYAPLIELAGGIIKKVDTSHNNFIPKPEDIEKAITNKTKAIFLVTPNNPTGKVIPKSALEAISKLVKKHDIWVFSDEIYAELIFDEEFTSIASLEGMQERTILLSGFSKAFAMTGYRIGYLCGHPDIVAGALKIHQYSALCANIISQYAAIDALKNTLPKLESMRVSYQERRDLCVRKFKEMGLEMSQPNGAFYCFPSIQSTGMTSEEFCLKLLEQKKVATVPGTAFGDEGEGFIRCCYATNITKLEKGLNLIQEFVNKNKKD